MLYGRLPTTRSERGPAASAPKSNVERVGFVHDEPLGMRDAAGQSGRELAVDLDDVQAVERVAQRNRERAGAAADLDHRVGRPRRE